MCIRDRYLPVLLLSWLNNSIPQFVLKRFVDYGAIGIYTNAVSIANILTIIQTGFNVYWAPFAYENYKTHKYRLTRVHKCISFLLISFAILIIIGQDFIYLDVYKRQGCCLSCSCTQTGSVNGNASYGSYQEQCIWNK